MQTHYVLQLTGIDQHVATAWILMTRVQLLDPLKVIYMAPSRGQNIKQFLSSLVFCIWIFLVFEQLTFN